MSIRTATPTADAPAPSMREESRSLVDRHTKVDGAIETPHDLRVEGQVTGTLRCDGVLYVASGAEIDADVTATDAIVEGAVSGSITCSGRLEIRSTGTIRATVQTRRLIIHEGALLEGRLDMEAQETEADQNDAPSVSQPQAEGSTSTAEQISSYSYLRSFSSPSASARNDDTDLPGRDSASGDAADPEDDEP